jgi:hypothetical protein
MLHRRHCQNRYQAVRFIMHRSALCILCSFVSALLLRATPTLSLPINGPADQAPQRSQLPLDLAQGQCWRRVGPFATQGTAWARRHQARNMGYPVSNGTYPCYVGGASGYCFNVFYPC